MSRQGDSTPWLYTMSSAMTFSIKGLLGCRADISISFGLDV